MQTLKQKFNALIHRHPWALQTVFALGIAMVAITGTYFSGIAKAAESNLVHVTDPTAGDVFYINGGFVGQGIVSINWSFDQWDGQQVVDLVIQTQDAAGNWLSRAPKILDHHVMDQNPASYSWTLPNASDLIGETKRIAVIVYSGGQTYTNYSANFKIRTSGVNFIAPKAGDQVAGGTLTRVKFYWHESIVPLSPIWSVLSYKDATGSWQILSQMLDTQRPYSDIDKSQYFDWNVPIVGSNFDSQFRLELFVRDANGNYTQLFKSGTSGIFTVTAGSAIPAVIGFEPILANGTIYLGNIYQVNFGGLATLSPVDIILQGEGTIQPKQKVLATNFHIPGNAAGGWDWNIDYFADADYAFYHNAHHSARLLVNLAGTTQTIAQTAVFNFDRLIKFNEPQDGTLQWPGGIPNISYASGTTVPVSFWYDREPSHWRPSGGTTARLAALYYKPTVDTTWQLLAGPADFSQGTPTGTYTYNWNIPVTNQSYTAELMTLAIDGGTVPVAPPASPRYYAKTYRFTVTPPTNPTVEKPRLVLKPNPSISAQPNGTFDVDVYLDPAAGQPAGGFKYSLTFDPTYLEVQAPVTTNLFFHMGGTFDNTAGTVTAQDFVENPNAGLTTETKVSTIHFRAKAQTGITNIAFDGPTDIAKNFIATISGNVLPASVQGTSVTIGTSGSHPFSATYYSQTFDVTTNGSGPTALGGVKAVWHEAPTDGIDVRFSVGFFKHVSSGDTGLWEPVFNDSTVGLPAGTFDAEGYHTISDTNEEALIDPFGTGYLMSWLQSHPQFGQIQGVRIRIYMQSPDITNQDLSQQPSVQSVNLDYTATPNAGEIGVINFVATGSEPIPGIQTVSLGQTASFKTKAISYEDVNFVGEVQFGLDGVVPSGSGLIGVPHPPDARMPINDISDTDALDNESGVMEYTFDTTGVAPGIYTITFNGHDTGLNGGNPNRTFRAAVGQLTIAGTSAGFAIAVSPATQAVVKGQDINYTVTVVRNAPFAGTVTLTTSDIAAAFGTGVTATLSDTTLTATETTAVLTIATTANATAPQTNSFTVNAQSEGETDQTATAQLSIVAAEDAITLTLTIPVEGGKPTDATLLHPRFDVKIYDSATVQMTRTGLATDAQNRLTIVATRAELPNKTYTIYARSDRHLWSKSTVPATLVIGDAATYSLTFPTLKAGDLDANNKVNYADLNIDNTLANYSQFILGALGDLNNDGKINMGDLGFMSNINFSLWGDRLPDEVRP